MTTPVVQTDVYMDFQGLEKMRAQAKGDDEKTLREIAGQFEALFIQMMLSSMRDASLGEGLLDGEHTKTYESMFDRQISIDLSKHKGLGLAEMMVRQLSRSQDGTTQVTGSSLPVGPVQQAASLTPKQQAQSVTVAEQAVTMKNDWSPETPEEFVRDLWPHARAVANRLGTAPEVLIAQAALETGWGQHMIRGVDGSNSFNLFGIKADSRWTGDRVVNETVEFRDGLMRKERAHFRAYASVAESFSDYAEFLRGNPRYRDVFNSDGNGPAFVQALADAGYATDPDYFSKINRIMDGDRLKNALSTSADRTF
jgi:flagellar protein FlgJ